MVQRLLGLMGTTAFISGLSMPLPPRWQGSVISSASVDSRGEADMPKMKGSADRARFAPFMRSALFRYEANLAGVVRGFRSLTPYGLLSSGAKVPHSSYPR